MSDEAGFLFTIEAFVVTDDQQAAWDTWAQFVADNLATHTKIRCIAGCVMSPNPVH
jgi:hypothetical protein